ncbi:MAG: DUF929 family protein [Thermoplasmata archaeon]
MVDWDRVEQLRSKGWDWERIANDPKVGFHPEASVQDSGRALRGLYHRQKSRVGRTGKESSSTPRSAKKEEEIRERKWSLPRIGYLLVPVVGIWFAIAYLLPSPVGVLVPAVPYLALALVAVAFLLLFGLLRTTQARWSKAYRKSLVTGVVLGLVLSGVIALGGALLFDCPVLPPASTARGEPDPGWTAVTVSPWKEGGQPVVYFYGATWCPYCSASSWAIWKALTEFGTVTGTYTSYSYGPPEQITYIPEMVLANAHLASSTVNFQVSEYVAGSDGVVPGTSSCIQQAYVTAYSGSEIPFLVVNGQYLHSGISIIPPTNLESWAGGAHGGAPAVQSAVASENTSADSPWLQIETQAWWLMAFMVESCAVSVGQLASEYHWSSATQAAVTTDVQQI